MMMADGEGGDDEAAMTQLFGPHSQDPEYMAYLNEITSYRHILLIYD